MPLYSIPCPCGPICAHTHAHFLSHRPLHASHPTPSFLRNVPDVRPTLSRTIATRRLHKEKKRAPQNPHATCSFPRSKAHDSRSSAIPLEFAGSLPSTTLHVRMSDDVSHMGIVCSLRQWCSKKGMSWRQHRLQCAAFQQHPMSAQVLHLSCIVCRNTITSAHPVPVQQNIRRKVMFASNISCLALPGTKAQTWIGKGRSRQSTRSIRGGRNAWRPKRKR